MIRTHHNFVTCLMLLALPIDVFGDILSTTQTLQVSVGSNGKLSLPGSANLQATDTHFASSLSGTLLISYWVRTSDGGGGSITAQASSQFSPSGGPQISSVTYLCSGATLGTACSGVQSLATSAQSPVVALPGGACTGGGGICSTQEPNTVLLTLSAPNRPHYKTGTYSALITFTISTL